MIYILGGFLLPLAASVGVRRSTFLHASSGASFGPNDCVKVERSSAGTCVLRTQCISGTDLETTEFAFLCVLGDGEVQKHSYGQGGFDVEETYDSSVACDQCLGPNQTPQVALHAASAAATKDEPEKKEDEPGKKTDEEKAQAPAPPTKKEGPKGLPVDLHTDGAPWKNESAREKYLADLVAEPKHNVSFYGPDHCVQTYLGEKGTCIMKTKCKGEAIKDHELGLTCVEKDGKSVRHLFGKNAFNPEETFDTLIDCEICLGLDVAKLDKPTSIKDTIASLKTEVAKLNKSMAEVVGDVAELNKKVFPDKEGAAPPPEETGLIHQSRKKRTHHIKEQEEDAKEQDQDADGEDRVEDVEEDEAPRRHPKHKGHKKHHKKHHHAHKHHRHTHHVHQQEDEEQKPVQEVDSVQEVKEDQATDEDSQPAVSTDRTSETSSSDSDSDSDSDGW
jgi:hypothetical protein